MENKGLIFIPDISGFTRFINQTEIEHSRLIIQELLEIIINANQLELNVSEIEGDAVLFYKFGEPSNLTELYRQVKKMFCEFHRSLIIYDKFKFCQCAACMAVAGLSLKVITHYGEFTGYNVKNFQKLIGKDVIVAHQLLKNNIAQHEYWLVTESLLLGNLPDDLEEWMKWNKSAKQTENDNISFYYTQLSELKNELSPDPYPQLELSKKAKMITLQREYDTDIITLFHAAGDFNFRSRWQEGVRSVEEVGHFLPRVGMHCRLVYNNGEVITYASSYSFTSERIEFSETDAKKEYSTYYILEKIDDHKTRLTLDYYIRENPVRQIIFKLMKKRKMEDILSRSLQNLETVAKEIRLD